MKCMSHATHVFFMGIQNDGLLPPLICKLPHPHHLQVATLQVGPLWTACIMRALTVADGWMPLTVWAPARTQGVVEALMKCGNGRLFAALTAEEWCRLSDRVREVLALGHKALTSVDGAVALPTVHGDARLPNIMARRDDSPMGFQVMFVDFGWAGTAGKSRCEQAKCGVWMGLLHWFRHVCCTIQG